MTETQRKSRGRTLIILNPSHRIHYGFHGAKDIIFGPYSKKWAYMKKLSAQALR